MFQITLIINIISIKIAVKAGVKVGKRRFWEQKIVLDHWSEF